MNNISVNSELLKLLITQESGNDRMRKCIDTVLKECNACTELINNERHRESPSESSNG
ncbi:MAG: hypothetical protein R3208_03535 [Ketobacteraceae bacterium]|nr:hypothetical protein [Ketobacteraceae bacterium]